MANRITASQALAVGSLLIIYFCLVVSNVFSLFRNDLRLPAGRGAGCLVWGFFFGFCVFFCSIFLNFRLLKC
jgi:hypothetical protein